MVITVLRQLISYSGQGDHSPKTAACTSTYTICTVPFSTHCSVYARVCLTRTCFHVYLIQLYMTYLSVVDCVFFSYIGYSTNKTNQNDITKILNALIFLILLNQNIYAIQHVCIKQYWISQFRIQRLQYI